MEPKHLTKIEFGRRLHKLMAERGWNQSDLARRAFGTTEDANGYTVAKGRDSISAYVRGLAFPEPKNLQKLADAFGVEPQELLPNAMETAFDAEHPAFEVRQAHGGEGAWLRINRRVKFETAMEIASLLREEDTKAAK